jgi:hypothetical protein
MELLGNVTVQAISVFAAFAQRGLVTVPTSNLSGLVVGGVAGFGGITTGTTAGAVIGFTVVTVFTGVTEVSVSAIAVVH